ncbi:MAG: hypothetical protein ACRD36_00315, partial [Candidatus Acidiferrum sp.]
MDAPDEFAGKRVKCSACGSIMTVESRRKNIPPPPRPTKDMPKVAQKHNAATPNPKDAARPAAAPAGTAELIRFFCLCGKSMSVKSALAGRLVRCPACGETVMIPGRKAKSNPEVKPDDRPPSKESVPLDVEAANEDDESVATVPVVTAVLTEAGNAHGERNAAKAAKKGKRREKKDVQIKRSSRGKWLWAGLAAGLLFSIAGGFLAWYLYTRTTGPADEWAFLPDTAQGAMFMRVSEIVESPSAKKLLEPFKARPNQITGEMFGFAGVAPEE